MEPALTNNKIFWVDDDLCQNCLPCLAMKICPVRAIIRIDRDESPFIDTHRCHGCRLCMQECPSNAVRIR